MSSQPSSGPTVARATRESIERFVSGRTLALVGASATRRSFGTAACVELKARGYRVFTVHPAAAEIEGDRCWKSLADLPERVDRLLVSIKPDKAEAVVREAAVAGVRQIWFQQGSESADAVAACRQFAIETVCGECILMFAEPVASFHKFHRGLLRLFGRLPR